MQNLGQLTTSELRKLVRHASALTAMRPELPNDLYTQLDSYLSDLRTEQEDRASAELESRRAAKSADQAG